MAAFNGDTGWSPFHNRTGMFPVAAHEEAMARILFLAEQRWPTGWLIGPEGSGKTAALLAIRDELRRSPCEVIYLSLFGATTDEFWSQIALHLGSRTVETGLAARKTVRGLLAASAMIQRPITILLDDVDRSEAPLWDAIAGLVRIMQGSRPSHTVVLATAGAPPTGDLVNRIDLRAELPPFSLKETSDYVAHHLDETDSSFTFNDSALDALQQLSGGIPAAINRIADIALVSAQTVGSTTITPEMVQTASSELRITEDAPIVTFSVENRPTRVSA